jgi:Spy/CpxP family protein refolding chaperone
MKLYTLLPLAVLALGLAQSPIGPGRPAGRGRPSGPPPQRGVEALRPYLDLMDDQTERGIEELRQYLGLTDDQIQQIEKVRDAGRDSAQGLPEQVRTNEDELRGLLEAGTSDTSVVGKLVLDLDALRSQMKQSLEIGQRNLLSLLSSEQATKLQTLEDAAKLRPMIEGAARLGLLSQPVPPEPWPAGCPGQARGATGLGTP